MIDETDTLVGAAEPVRGGINDDSVFAWYERLLTQTGEDFDIIEQPRQAELIYSFEMLAGYDLVIWYSEDNKPYEYVNPETVAFREEMLRAYVNAGGRLMRCGRRMLKTIIPYYGVIEYIDGYILDEWLAPMTFDSAYAWPAFSNAYNRIQFVGANADNPSFPSFMLDTAKVRIPRWGSEHLNYLPEIDILWPRGETHSIYRTVVLPTDSTGFGNQPCGVMGQGEILLTFPLYFLYEADAQALLDSCIRVLRTYTFDIPDEPEPFIPSSVALHQNYPNPFNSATTFRFDLPQNDRVQLIIYNLLGQQVRVLLDQPFTAGSHLVTWDGKGATGQPLSSGVYVARMSANAARQSVKVVMLR